MSKPVFNPYLPLWEFVPDGEPHIFGDRLYVYGSHDQYGANTYCANPYTVWSAPLDDLSNWTCHGISYTGLEDPFNETKKRLMFAPDVCEKDGKYYLYYGLDTSDTISVAVADQPEGPFTFYGHVHYPDGTVWGKVPGEHKCFDPGVFVDDDGQVYLYSGFSTTQAVLERIKKRMPAEMAKTFTMTLDGSDVVKLADDMLTIKEGPYPLLPGVENSAGTGFEGHEFFEASSMRKFKDKYYAIYSSVNGHELCYAMSDHPMKGFEYKGVLHSNGDFYLNEDGKPSFHYANNHGSIVEINGEYYVFGHRHTGKSQYQRQGVAEKLIMNPDGTFDQAQMTSFGLCGGRMAALGEFPASIACVLKGKDGAVKADYRTDYTQVPVIALEDGLSFVANLLPGSKVGYRYFQADPDQREVELEAMARNCTKDPAVLEIALDENGPALAKLEILPTVCENETKDVGSECSQNPVDSAIKNGFKAFKTGLYLPAGDFSLFFRAASGGPVDLLSFKLG